MRVWFAGHDAVQVQVTQQRAEGLLTVQVIRQDRDLQGLEAGGVAFNPAFDGRLLAVLFGGAVLRGDEFRFQRDALRIAGRHQHRQ